MKALSLTQPWATLVAIGAKRIETRGWWTAYRGELLIHATKTMPRDCRELCDDEPFKSALIGPPGAERRGAQGAIYDTPPPAHWYYAAHFTYRGGLPQSAIVAVARLVDVIATERVESTSEIDRVMRVYKHWQQWRWPLTETERAFGDFGPGRWGWLLDDVRPVSPPVACAGARRLWVPEPAVIAAVSARLDKAI